MDSPRRPLGVAYASRNGNCLYLSLSSRNALRANGATKEAHMNANTCRKALTAQISGSTAKGFTAVITAETLDRDGEVLIPSGMNSKEFEQNPVLFWNHDYALPVGKSLGVASATSSASSLSPSVPKATRASSFPRSRPRSSDKAS